MLCTFKLGKNFVRNAIVNSVENRLLPLEAGKACRGASNSLRLSQIYFKHFRKYALLTAKNKIEITDRFVSSSFHTKSDNNKYIVKHDPKRQMFYVDVDGVVSGYIPYEKGNGVIVLKHIKVSEELRGYGVGKRIAKEALEYVAKNNMKLEIQCSFVNQYVLKYEPKYLKYLKK